MAGNEHIAEGTRQALKGAFVTAEPSRAMDPSPTLAGAKDPFYIAAPAPRADELPRVLKQGDTFAVFDHYGDITPSGLGEEGVYHAGTRFLSCLLLGLGKERPLLLNSTVKEDNDRLTVDLSNPDMRLDGDAIPRGTLHLLRNKFIWQGVCYEDLRIRNYGLGPIETTVSFHFEADYADIFEVRGTHRARRGRYLGGAVEDGQVTLAYEGLDAIVRRTRLSFSPRPSGLSENDARFHVRLAPHGEAQLLVTIACELENAPPSLLPYDQAERRLESSREAMAAQSCHIETSNEHFNAWVSRALADLHMMTTDTSLGPYPYAGVPWFSTPFGRDGLLTALESLWFYPTLARGVLRYLAATQATELIPEQDAEPGKILHESRRGEMAALGEIPFGRYYGSVDATPLFVLLAGAYYERTADHAFIESIWPNVERALTWIDRYGDPDGDGFVEYQRHSPRGLVQQGWKDSSDSVFHADGSLAPGPIALCEVQAYVYGARRAAARLASVLGRGRLTADLLRQADDLQSRFEEVFWCDELSTYALALDGQKTPCKVHTSNAGQCLLTGIARPEHARRTAHSLLSPGSFSGWGIRTVDSSELRYNPMSYHNGSIWPHDNALIAFGMARYGLKDEALRVLTGLRDASLFLELYRMPELFCGFRRSPGQGPTLYPVACSPQAWAAAAVFLLLQACLGLEVNSVQRQICFHYPLLPEFLAEVKLTNLRVGDAVVDLLLRRHGSDVGINVLRREGAVQILMVK
jgi:glycogen debranching enzyme